jgi:hypothetical protein
MEHNNSWGSSSLWISDEIPGISPRCKIHGRFQKHLLSVLGHMSPVDIPFMISCNMFDFYKRKSYRLWVNVENFCRTGQTAEKIRFACRITKERIHTTFIILYV